MRKLLFPYIFISAVIFAPVSRLCAQGGGSGLPIIYISTAAGDSLQTFTRAWLKNAVVRIADTGGRTFFLDTAAQVKGRGHSSFDKPKKPLSLRLSRTVVIPKTPQKSEIFGDPVRTPQKSEIFGDPVRTPQKSEIFGDPVIAAGKRWVLLSGFMDHSLMRNYLALRVAQQTSLRFTPRAMMVDVVVNGRYAGVYTLCRPIRIGKKGVSTNLLLELDQYRDDRYMFRSPRRQLPVKIRFPKNPTAKLKKQTRHRFLEIEEILYRGQAPFARIWNYIDSVSFADYFIVYELCQNAEPNGPRSVYMYSGADGRLYAGPVWDFDLAFEGVGLDSGGDLRPERFLVTGSPRQGEALERGVAGFPKWLQESKGVQNGVRHLTVDSLYNRRALWYDRLLEDSAFVRLVSRRWTELRPRFAALTDSLPLWKSRIAVSAQRDQQMWAALDPARFDNHPSFLDSYNNLLLTYKKRIEVLDNYFLYDRQ